MEDKNEKKAALNDELLDKVAGGAGSLALYKCTNCGYPMEAIGPCKCPRCETGRMELYR